MAYRRSSRCARTQTRSILILKTAEEVRAKDAARRSRNRSVAPRTPGIRRRIVRRFRRFSQIFCPDSDSRPRIPYSVSSLANLASLARVLLLRSSRKNPRRTVRNRGMAVQSTPRNEVVRSLTLTRRVSSPLTACKVASSSLGVLCELGAKLERRFRANSVTGPKIEAIPSFDIDASGSSLLTSPLRPTPIELNFTRFLAKERGLFR